MNFPQQLKFFDNTKATAKKKTIQIHKKSQNNKNIHARTNNVCNVNNENTGHRQTNEKLSDVRITILRSM